MKSTLHRLMETHRRLDRTLRSEQERRWKDPVLNLRLKKLMLRVKDLIHRLTLQLGRA